MPLLAALGIFGVLVVTATPISVLIDYVRTLGGLRGGTDDAQAPAEEEEVPAPKRRRRRAAEGTPEQLSPDRCYLGGRPRTVVTLVDPMTDQERVPALHDDPQSSLNGFFRG